jgi:phosphate transport system substrate-binding protein
MSLKNILFVFCLCWILPESACDSSRPPTPSDKPGIGTIQISVDESFQPVIEEVIKTYQTLYPKAHILASYKTESECLKDFFYDSSCRIAIVGRGLSEKEAQKMTDSLMYRPGWRKLATDAIALVVPYDSEDTLFTIQDLKDMLSGKRRDYQLVFDGLRATSTYRFLQDSLLQGKIPDTALVRAAKNSSALLDFVAESKEKILGLVGVSWIGNPEEPAQTELLKKVKIAYLRCDACAGTPFVKPMQASMMTGRYPLRRSMYYLIKENYKGLGTGFISFLKYEQGQLIFRRSYLRPEMELGVRNVHIHLRNNQEE